MRILALAIGLAVPAFHTSTTVRRNKKANTATAMPRIVSSVRKRLRNALLRTNPK